MKIQELKFGNLSSLWSAIDYYRINKRINFLPKVEDPQDLDKWFDSNKKSKEVVVLLQDDNVIGFVFYQYHRWKEVVDIDIMLLPEYVGKGLGDEALETIEKWLIENYSLIGITAEAVNDASKNLLKRNGYKNDPSHWFKINEFYKLVSK